MRQFLRQVIKCPCCGNEYLPAEIFAPGDFVGKPREIIRDPLGKIIYEEYDDDEEPNLTQSFTCDKCGKQFVVEATVIYKVKEEEEEKDFSTETASLLD